MPIVSIAVTMPLDHAIERTVADNRRLPQAAIERITPPAAIAALAAMPAALPAHCNVSTPLAASKSTVNVSVSASVNGPA